MYARRIKRLLEERKIKQIVVAADLKISEGQVSRILSGATDMRVAELLYFAELLNMPVWALLGHKKAQGVELVEVTRQFVDRVLPMLEPDRVPEVAEARTEARMVRLLRVAATPDNETYDDDPEPRRYEVPAEFHRPHVSGICVCRVDGFRHLKRVFYRGRNIELVSSAPKRRSWKFDPEPHDFAVLGIVIGRTGRVAR